MKIYNFAKIYYVNLLKNILIYYTVFKIQALQENPILFVKKLFIRDKFNTIKLDMDTYKKTVKNYSL